MLASRVLAARTVARQQRRGIVDYLTKWPDTVMETKKIQMKGGVRQGEYNPTWLKQPGDQAVVAFGAVLVAYGLAQCAVGYYRLASGTGKMD